MGAWYTYACPSDGSNCDICPGYGSCYVTFVLVMGHVLYLVVFDTNESMLELGK